MRNVAVGDSKLKIATDSVTPHRVFNPLNHPIAFTYPARIAMSGWIGHIPFGIYVIDVLRPKSIVELGTHHGVSYCAFCQAVKELGLETSCYAIDSWQGDSHSGFYGPEVLADLEEHHNPRYGDFSQLIQTSFDDALGCFADHTFDLLHIDGFHTYEAVKRDFEKWQPKLTDRGVVLFHDINVRERGFGVWKFWEEIKLGFPHFEFVHSNGLGVLAVGERYPDELNELFRCSAEEATKVRSFFACLGERLEITQELKTLKLAAQEQSDASIRLQERLEDQLRRIEEEIVSQRTGYETQQARQLEELSDARAEYERQFNRQKIDVNEMRVGYEAEMKRQLDEFSETRSEFEAQLALRETDLARLRSELFGEESDEAGLNKSLRAYLESPKSEDILSDSLEIRGWAYSTAGSVRRIEAFLDDRFLGSIGYGLERSDVVAAFPEEAVPLGCGYAENISLEGLSVEGQRMFRVGVYDEQGNRQFFKRKVMIEAASPLTPPSPNLTETKEAEKFADLKNTKTTTKQNDTELPKNTSTVPVPAANAELVQQMEEVIAEFQKRMELDPSILDWDSGLELAVSFPHLAVFSPLPSESFDPTLPYLDHSIDIVVTSSPDPERIAEARRVAAIAVVRSKTLPDKLQRLTLRKAKSRISLDIEWLTDEVNTPPMPRTSIIIPVFNKFSYTENCLEQLITTLPQDFDGEIIVVDDASSDETADSLAQWADTDGRIKILRNPQNLGFITSCNRGAEFAQGDVIIFLNNDTLPLSGWLPPLLRILRDRPDAGAVGAKLVYGDGTLQEAGGVIFSDGSGCNFGKFDKAANKPLFNFVREVDYCSGALLATRRDLFIELGGFDERFKPAYYEDVDYCFTLRERGYRVYYQPESVIVHFEGISSGTDVTTGVKSYQVVNQHKFIAKWSEELKRQYPAPDRYEPSTFHTLARRNGSANAHGN